MWQDNRYHRHIVTVAVGPLLCPRCGKPLLDEEDLEIGLYSGFKLVTMADKNEDVNTYGGRYRPVLNYIGAAAVGNRRYVSVSPPPYCGECGWSASREDGARWAKEARSMRNRLYLEQKKLRNVYLDEAVQAYKEAVAAAVVKSHRSVLSANKTSARKRKTKEIEAVRRIVDG